MPLVMCIIPSHRKKQGVNLMVATLIAEAVDEAGKDSGCKVPCDAKDTGSSVVYVSFPSMSQGF